MCLVEALVTNFCLERQFEWCFQAAALAHLYSRSSLCAGVLKDPSKVSRQNVHRAHAIGEVIHPLTRVSVSR